MHTCVGTQPRPTRATAYRRPSKGASNGRGPPPLLASSLVGSFQTAFAPFSVPACSLFFLCYLARYLLSGLGGTRRR